ncbi:MAG TPA: HlyD family efflux transporter periplasmic adaptor subunit [Polyangiaceae bacterium]|nr:HlyD family efflux transporter periplasmic adaptor subunit [Polyangiaceae bacterium]
MPFHRTLRALEHERPRGCPPSLIAALLLLGGWSAWMVEARVPVYAVSQLGRLEVSTTPHRSAALTPGRVSRVFAEIGQLVTSGEALVQLDDTLERRRVDEASAELDAIDLRIGALDAQRSVEQRVREWQLRASEASLSHSRVALAEADQRSEFRRQQADISSNLRRERVISEIQSLEAAEQLSISRWQVNAAEASLEKERVASRYADEVQAAQIAGIARQLADLRAARLTAEAALETARAALDRTVVRAPVAGRIGSMAALQAGDVAREGDVVATVIPDEHLKVMAEFAPAEAMGRVRQGQPAQIRLSGFSVAEFGVLDAVVSRVASEPHAGTVRVELTLPPDSHTRVPLQHGLPGSVEVCVESAAPWRLLLRSLDRFIDDAAPSDAPPSDGTPSDPNGRAARAERTPTPKGAA